MLGWGVSSIFSQHIEGWCVWAAQRKKLSGRVNNTELPRALWGNVEGLLVKFKQLAAIHRWCFNLEYVLVLSLFFFHCWNYACGQVVLIAPVWSGEDFSVKKNSLGRRYSDKYYNLLFWDTRAEMNKLSHCFFSNRNSDKLYKLQYNLKHCEHLAALSVSRSLPGGLKGPRAAQFTL